MYPTELCLAGNYMTDTGCQQCEADTYSGDAATECTPCSGGMISAAGSSSEDDCQYGLLNYADNISCQYSLSLCYCL